MPTQKEMIADILASQKKQGKLLTEMDIALRGPNYDPHDGGLIKEVHDNTECIKTIKKKQTKIITWGVTIFSAINLAGILMLILNSIRN